MLDAICRELNNYFETNKYFGRFIISDGTIDLSDLIANGSLQEGQYFRIVGSVFNDGIYQYPASDLHDETFEKGAIWTLALPKELVELSAEIENWNEKNRNVISSPFQSESFGGYSYTKASGNNSNGTFTWKDQFASQLSHWRKIRCRY